jgi:signal transduction histidine kinase
VAQPPSSSFLVSLGEPADSWSDWLKEAARKLVEVSGAPGSAIWLYDESVDALQIKASFQMSEEYVAYGQQSALRPAARLNAPIYRSFQSGEWVEVSNPATVPEWSHFSDVFRIAAIGYVCTAPIALGSQRVGAIALYFPEPTQLSEFSKMHLRLLCAELGGQVVNRETHGRLANKIRELEESIATVQIAVTKMRELDRLKTNLLSAISHELRTPLTAIIGFAEFLEDGLGGVPTDGQLTFIHEIQEGSGKLLQLINDLLDFTHLQAGTLQLSLQEADVSLIVKEAVESLSSRCRQANLRVAECYDAQATFGQVDALRVRQIALKLLDNAIKFTPSGGCIEIAVSGHPHVVRVEIGDSGVGISAEGLGLIFDNFSQEDSSSTRAAGGVGLGLALGKALVVAHGGTIGANSQPGHGSTFWFELPCVPAVIRSPLST